MPIKFFKNIDNNVFQSGNVVTDSQGQVTVPLSCFNTDEVPCVTVSSFGVDGNSNVNSTRLLRVGSTWQIDIITSAPNTTVNYAAFKSNRIDIISPPNLVTQDLFDIVTQVGELIVTQ